MAAVEVEASTLYIKMFVQIQNEKVGMPPEGRVTEQGVNGLINKSIDSGPRTR